MEAARKLGKLRGRAAALLAFYTSPSPSQGAAPSSVIEELRDLLREMNGVKRDDILPRDTEREEHEREEHEDGGFELDTTDNRGMEGLENALASIGDGSKDQKLREGELLDHLESRLVAIEGNLRAPTSA